MKTHALACCFGVVLLIQSCTPKDDYEALLKKTEINPAFEKSPPVASNVSFEVLEKPTKNGENVRFIATFKNQKMPTPYLAININDTKMMLRDDGKGADKVAGDNEFSIFLTEDPAAIQQELNERKKLILASEKPQTFKNRSARTLKLDEIRKFEFNQIEKGRPLAVPIDFGKFFRRLTVPGKTLMVTDRKVVEDPTRTFNPCTQEGNPAGVWTFGELMRQMASPNPGSIATEPQVSAFVRNWLRTWMVDQTVNSESIPARTRIEELISEWERKSSVRPGGILKMKFAPFKLIAIVNRLDLRGNSGYGFSDAGEGRLVFNAMRANCSPVQFTVIFEYGIRKKSCNAVAAFASEWNSLNDMELGSEAYNAALQHITDQFTKSGTNRAGVNQNSINQIRTNENELNVLWELREFNLMAGGQLGLTTVKQEPAVKYNARTDNADVRRLATYINGISAAIENSNYTIPPSVPFSETVSTPTPFLGGKSHIPLPPTGPAPNAHHWNGALTTGPAFIVSDEARHVFSLNTCSGCHGGETQTSFTHIKPAPFGSQAALSGFLTGITVSDAARRPAASPTIRSFNDLSRRNADLSDLISNVCIKRPFFELVHKLTFVPVRMTH